MGEFKHFNPGEFFDAKEARRMDRFSVYAVASAVQALQDAGLKVGDFDPERAGVILGNGIGGIEVLGDNFKKMFDRGPKAIHPLCSPMMIANIAPGNVAIKLNLQGPSITVVTACASGTDAIGDSLRWIREGKVDVMLAGGTEATIVPLGLASFCVLQAVSTKYNDTPERASRPFDVGRGDWAARMNQVQLIPIFQAWSPDAVVWDGASAHRGQDMGQVGFARIFLPPYSPELNPPERVFEVLRQAVEGVVYPSLYSKRLAIDRQLRRLNANKAQLRSLIGWHWLLHAFHQLPHPDIRSP